VLIPLTHELNRSECGHQVHGTEWKISNDLQLIGRNEDELKNEIKIVKTISRDIRMEFGLVKCARIS
jgi:hypothetical protein